MNKRRRGSPIMNRLSRACVILQEIYLSISSVMLSVITDRFLDVVVWKPICSLLYLVRRVMFQGRMVFLYRLTKQLIICLMELLVKIYLCLVRNRGFCIRSILQDIMVMRLIALVNTPIRRRYGGMIAPAVR